MYGMTSEGLGLRIRRARERRRWTQKELAEALPADPQGRRPGVRSIGRWERGEAVPRNAIGALEDVLGVSLEDGAEPEEVYTDPAERAIWEDPLLPSIELRRSLIGQLRAARREQSQRVQRPPA